jgi:uncharacterized protein YrrD
MKFLFGTPVYAADDEKVGEIKEVVIDPRTKAVIYLVVQEGLLFENDTLIPVTIVASATEEAIRLRVDKAEIGNVVSEFRQDEFVAAADAAPAQAGKPLQGAYWAPPRGATPSFPLIPPGFRPNDLAPDAAIPIENVMLMHGSSVSASDGKIVGRLDEVLTDDDEKITHIVIENGLVYARPKLVPVDWIAGIEDNAIALSVDKAVVDRMPDYDRPEK